MKYKRTERVIINSIYGIIYKITSIILPFVIRTIIIKQIGEAYAGLNSLFTSVLSILSLAELGFSNAVVYSMYRPIEMGDIQKISALLNYFKKIYKVIGTTILAVGICVLPFIDNLVSGAYPEDINLRLLYLMYLANIVMGYYLFAYRTSLFLADQRNDVITKIMLYTTLLQYLLQFIILILFKNYYFYILVFVLMVIPQNFAYYCVSKKLYPQYICSGDMTLNERRKITSQVKALIGHKIGATAIISIDSIIISSFLGLVELSRYGNYYYIINSVVAIGVIVSQSMLGSIGNKIITSSQVEVIKLFDNLSSAWMWFVSWCSIAIFCLINPFVSLWLGEKFCYPQIYVAVMVLYYYSWQFRTMGLIFKDADGLWQNDWYKPYMGVFVKIVLSISFVLMFHNILSVLIPTIIILLFIYFPIETAILYKVLFQCNKRKYLSNSLFIFFQTIVAAFVTYYCVALIPMSGVFGFSLKIIVVLIVPNVILFVINRKNPIFFEVRNKIFEMIENAYAKIMKRNE